MSILSSLNKFILDIIFPIACLGCGGEGVWLCHHCLTKIPLNKKSSCPVCHKSNDGSVCRQCQIKTSLNGMLIATNYDQPLIQKAIHVMKYSFVFDLAQSLTLLLADYLKNFDIKHKSAIMHCPSFTILAPVPLHKKRLRERGFNQAELLAKNLDKHFPFNYQPLLLKRIRYTTAQAQLNKKERENNLQNAFALNKSFNIRDKNVILIDDVATTLTTLNECAKVLKQAGCKEVWGLVIARGS